MRGGVLIFFILLFCSSCATTNLKPVTEDGFSFKDDEKRLWVRSDEEQDVLNQSGLIYQDQSVTEYLNTIVAKLCQEEMDEHIAFKIYVLKDPHFNAFAFPNGAIYVHTGILARAENEAQIATLLAHEMTHCTHRHAVKNIRSIKNTTALLATLQVTTAGLGGGLDALANVLGTVGTMAAVSGYSKNLESEADKEGLGLMVKAGYDPNEAPKLFLHIKEELEEEDINEPFFFGSHPRLNERIKNYERLINQEYQNNTKRTKNTETFLKYIQEIILENAELDLRLGRYEFAEKGVEKYLQLNQNNHKAYYLLGEIYNRELENGDIDRSISYYQKSISINSSYPDPYRELGLIYYKQEKKTLAKQYFEEYLNLSTEAQDVEYIKFYLQQI